MFAQVWRKKNFINFQCRQQSLYHGYERRNIYWLEQIIISSYLQSGTDIFVIVVSAEDDNRAWDMMVLQYFQKLKPTQVRHFIIRNNKREIVFFKQLQCIIAIAAESDSELC